MRYLRLALAFAVAMTAVPAAPAGPILHDFNLVVGGDLTSTSEVEGRTIVGGSLNGPASNYGIRLTPPGNFTGVDSLVVRGNITATNVNVQAGNVRIGGTVSGNINFNGGGQLFQDPAGAQALANAAIAEMLSTSAFYSGLAADSGITNPAGPSAVTFTATPGADGVAVFNVNGSLFSDPDSQQYELILGAGVTPTTTFVFNVSGTNINFNQGNFVGLFNDPSLRPFLIWNFADATNINLDRAFTGSLLAPGANLTNSTNIDGSVFIGGNFRQNGEVHLPTFTGILGPGDPGTAAVPEPASWLVLLGIGLPGLLAARRLRRAARSAHVPEASATDARTRR